MTSQSRPIQNRVTVAEFAGLKVHIVDRGSADPPKLVVLMHGFGAPGTDLVPLANALPSAIYAFPEAPIDLSSQAEFAPFASFGPPPRAWWPIDMLGLQRAIESRDFEAWVEHVPSGLPQAAAQLERALSDLQDHLGISDEDSVLGGFSQGAMLATHIAMTQQRRLRALVVLSGSLIANKQWSAGMARRAFPVFVSHGSSDAILPIELAERLCTQLAESSSSPVEWVNFDGPHGIPRSVLLRLADFILRNLQQD